VSKFDEVKVTTSILGQVVKTVRQRAGLRQADVCLAMGRGKPWLAALEAGDRPRVIIRGHVDDLALGLGMTVPDLLHLCHQAMGKEAVKVPPVVLRALACDADVERLLGVMLEGGVTARDVLGMIPRLMAERAARAANGSTHEPDSSQVYVAK
jgi:transcriptional regulator with XRE-family HTH domain